MPTATASSAAAADDPLPNRLREPLPTVLGRVAPGWRDLVQAWHRSEAGHALIERVEARRLAGVTLYPAEPMRALALTAPEAVRVVVLGQDPYHGPGQAEGLAFSVPDRQRMPPSLRNINTELRRDLGIQREHASLRGWAEQGVLLLNTVLTVEDGRPASHAGWGWEALTDQIVMALAQSRQPIVFMLWGAHAARKRPLLGAGPAACQAVLLANHPSPLSARRGPAPFIGCGHFGQANAWLGTADPTRPPIDWKR